MSPLSSLRPISVGNGRPDNLTEAVYATLTGAIVNGQLAPGTILSAVQLSSQLDVSRTPVQQALLLLGNDGLVEVSSGRRARVASFTRDKLFHVFEMRRILEGPATELAAGRMDRRHLEPLRRTVDSLSEEHAELSIDEHEGWRRRWADSDAEFHQSIAHCCGNPLLARDINRYRLLHHSLNQVNAQVVALGQAVREHDEILRALEARDGIAARSAMEKHIVNWQMYFMESMPT